MNEIGTLGGVRLLATAVEVGHRTADKYAYCHWHKWKRQWMDRDGQDKRQHRRASCHDRRARAQSKHFRLVLDKFLGSDKAHQKSVNEDGQYEYQ